MSIQLAGGVAAAVTGGDGKISFSVGALRFEAAPHPKAADLKSGDFVHVLAEVAEDREVREVLALRRYGRDPVYFGPHLGWHWLVLCVAIVFISILSRTPWLMALPTLIGAVHCHFLLRRASLYARFSAELSDALVMASHEVAPVPTEPRAPVAVYSTEGTSMSSEKGHGTQ